MISPILSQAKESGYIPEDKDISISNILSALWGDEDMADVLFKKILPNYIGGSDPRHDSSSKFSESHVEYDPQKIYDFFKEEYGSPVQYINPGNILSAVVTTAFKQGLGLDPDPKAGKFQEELISGVWDNPEAEGTPYSLDLWKIFQEYEKDYNALNPEGEKVVMDLFKRGLYNSRNLQGYQVMKDYKESLEKWGLEKGYMENSTYQEGIQKVLDEEGDWSYGSTSRKKAPFGDAAMNYLLNYYGGALPDMNYDESKDILDII